MDLVIRGHDLPGRTCITTDDERWSDVHVALQVGKQPEGAVPADAERAEWTTRVDVVAANGSRDFHGPAVHGTRGERHVYLTWGDLHGGTFSMFRRAKLMLDDMVPEQVPERVTVSLRLTCPDGTPLCARVPADALEVSPA